MYKLIEKRFDLKKFYSERDWLTQNRQEVPQSYPLYERTQIVAKMEHPRVQKVLLHQMWTEPAFFTHPFYTGLVKQMQRYIEIYFPGIVCELYDNPPLELDYAYLKENKMIKTRVRGDTKRQQFNTENLFDVIIRHKLQPKSNEALFILTDSDLYP